jgi:hypothetical protein
MSKARKSVVSADILDATVPVAEPAAPGADRPAGSAPAERARTPADPDWTEWVLDQLDPGEVYETEPKADGRVTRHPTVAGLRRFVEANFAVLDSVPAVETTWGPGHAVPTVTVTHTLRVRRTGEAEVKTFGGAACVGPHNLKDIGGAVYPGETADTRARGRAYSNLLGLATCTKEEIAAQTVPAQVRVSDTVTPAQVLQLANLCKTNNLNVRKFINCGELKYSQPTDIPRAKFERMFEALNRLQQAAHRTAMGEDGLTDKDKEFLAAHGPWDPDWRTSA